MSTGRPSWAGERRTVRLFALDVDTDFPFRGRLVPSSGGPPALELTAAQRPPAGATGVSSPSYRSPMQLPDGQPALTLHRAGGWDLLDFPGRARIYCSRRAIRVLPAVAPGPAGASGEPRAGLADLEVLLLGTVLAYWLERTGWPVLHAAAIEVDGRAVAFLAGNRGGKSSLAAQLVASGHPLLTDDLLAVEVGGRLPHGRPGYPQMRLWPDAAAVFQPDAAAPERILPAVPKLRLPVGTGGFGTFCDRPLPLACLYLPERSPDTGDVSSEVVPPAQAVMELIARSFIPRLAAAAGLQEQRLTTFARLVERVPVKRLRYPSGYRHLPAVARAVLADL